jgi:hypothetical protein
MGWFYADEQFPRLTSEKLRSMGKKSAIAVIF